MKPETTITEVDGVIQITGYAYTFEDDQVQGGPANGGWIERIERKTLKLPRKMVLHHNIEQYRHQSEEPTMVGRTRFRCGHLSADHQAGTARPVNRTERGAICPNHHRHNRNRRQSGRLLSHQSRCGQPKMNGVPSDQTTIPQTVPPPHHDTTRTNTAWRSLVRVSHTR